MPQGIGRNGLRYIDKTLTAAQIRALRATQITLVPAPGAGKVLIFDKAQFFLDFGTAHDAPVNAGDDLGIRYTDGSGQLVATLEATAFINASADAFRLLYPHTTASGTAAGITPPSNAALVLDNIGAAEYAGTGTSTLKVRVWYFEVSDLS
jgi:hypothetical protein